MNHSSSCRELVRALQLEAEVLEQLVRAMKRDRNSYVALRPSELLDSVSNLDSLRESAASRAEARAAASAKLARELGMPEDTRLRPLADRCNARDARAIHSVRARLDAVARAIQIESRVGTRLLEISRRVQEGLVHELAGITASRTPSHAPGYDRSAHSIAPSARAGTLVDGKV